MTNAERLQHLTALYAKRRRLDAQIATLEAVIEEEGSRIYHKVAPCGTDSGYYRHRRTLGEDACQPCLVAHAAATRRAAAKRRRGAA